MKKFRIHWFSVLLFACALLLLFPLCSYAVTIKLKVAYNSNMPPYQFMTENGQPAGMHIDILNAIAKRNQLELEYIPMEKSSDCEQALNSGSVDLVLGAIMDSRHPRQFTNELSSSPLCLFVTNEFSNDEELRKKLLQETAIFEYGTASYSLIANIGAAQYLAVGNQRDVFENHINGHAYAIIGVKDSILYQLYEQKLENRYTIANNYMSTVRYGILTRKGNTELQRILNNGLMVSRVNGEYDRFYRKWTVEEPSEKLLMLMRRVMITGAILLTSCVIYTLFNQRIKYLLKKQVAEQTMEIQLANAELTRRIRQIENANNFQRSLIENSPNGMIYFDQDYNIRIINNNARLLAGDSSLQAGMNIQKIAFFHNLLSHIKDNIFEMDTDFLSRIVTLEQEDGILRSYQCNIRLMTGGMETSGAILTLLDITKEEQEKQAAFEKEKSKSMNRMIAGIAHEIKNPLMSIKTFALLLKTRQGDKQVEQMVAEYVPGEVERINQLVEGLINYARPSQRQISVISLSQVVNECIYLAEAAVKKGSIRLESHVHDDPLIQGDKNQLKQILINIMINGIESMEKKITQQSDLLGKLVLSIEIWSRDNLAYISILDHGCGMSEKAIRRCTDPFFTTKTTGTGLGLALSKSYIEENNGTLTIESREEEYTKITIQFKQYLTKEDHAS